MIVILLKIRIKFLFQFLKVNMVNLFNIKKNSQIIILFKASLIIFFTVLNSCSKQMIGAETKEEPRIYSNYDQQTTNLYLEGLRYKELGDLNSAQTFLLRAYQISKEPYIKEEVITCQILNNEYQKALANINDLIAGYGEKQKYLELKLEILQEIGSFQEKTELLKKLIEEDNQILDYYHLLNRYYYHENKLPDLIDFYDEILFELSPTQENAVKDYLLLSIKKDKIDQVISLVTNYLEKVDYQDYQILCFAVRYYLFKKDYQNALKLQEKITSAPEKSSFTDYNIHYYLLKEEKRDQDAHKLLLLMTQKYPKNREVNYNLALSYAEMDSLKKAEEACLKAMNNDSTDCAIYDILGNIFESKDFKKAQKYYQEGIGKYPNNPNLLNNYAYFLAGKNMELNLALKMSLKANKIVKNNPNYMDTLGWIYFKIDNNQQAATIIEAAIIYAVKEKNPNTDILYEHLGEIYLKINKLDLALKYFELSKNLGNEAAKKKFEELKNEK